VLEHGCHSLLDDYMITVLEMSRRSLVRCLFRARLFGVIFLSDLFCNRRLNHVVVYRSPFLSPGALTLLMWVLRCLNLTWHFRSVVVACWGALHIDKDLFWLSQRLTFE